MGINNRFPERLKELRKKKNITQLEMSKDLDINNKSLSQYERGLSKPDINTLNKISKYFDVSIDYLIGNIDEKTETKNRATNEKDDSIKNRIEELYRDLENKEVLMFHGNVVLDEETKDLLKSAIKTAIKVSDMKAKEIQDNQNQRLG